MRKLLVLVLLAALVPAGLALGKSASPILTGACAKANLNLIKSDQLTIGTDNPAYPSWFDDKQSIFVRRATAVAKVRSVAGLRPFTLSVQLVTTSYQFVKSRIKPAGIKVYNTNDKAVFALKNKLVDGVVVDLPTAFYVTAAQVPNSKILGQFASKTGEHFGMVFQKGNSLVT